MSAWYAKRWLLGLVVCTLLVACGAETSSDASERVALTSAALSSPDAHCTSADYGGSGGHRYFFCTDNRSWATARSKCQALGFDFDLASIQSSGEQTFVRSHISEDSWLGGTDSAVEGAWRWVQSSTQFWQGVANGSAVGGAYTNFETGQPNNVGNQDCLQMEDNSAGKWNDDLCGNLWDFVCEGDACPNDPNKADPGQCGCGSPDTDSDNDGTADCVDGCRSDSTKAAPGQCGCGTPDVDSDGDGTANCLDACPTDAGRVAAPCSPDDNCQYKKFGGSDYFFCDHLRSWSTAKAKCEGVGMQLARVDSSAENDFIRQQILTDRWIGGTDMTTEGDWRWVAGNDAFWLGAAGGAPVNGAYTNWDTGQPNNLGNEDCLQLDHSGKWRDDECSDNEQYICEARQRCAIDPTSSTCTEITDADCDEIDATAEGQAGLNPSAPDGRDDPDGDDIPTRDEIKFGGNPFDSDTDGDGIPDTTDLLGGTDLDGDGVAFETDKCPNDPNSDQLDADGDGVGDACDDDPLNGGAIPMIAVQVTRRTDTGAYALAIPSLTESARLKTDQFGHLPTGSSFRLAEEGAGTVLVHELYSESLHRHAYVISDAERALWESRGYGHIGTLGNAFPSAPGFGTPVVIYRLQRGTGASTEQAVTADNAEHSALLAQGYSDVQSLGWGLKDNGRMAGRRSVVRYKKVSGSTLHSYLRDSEAVALAGYSSDGPVFRVLAEKLDSTVPLFRLRTLAGDEALATSDADLANLVATGYVVDGLLGHVFSPFRTFQTGYRVVKLSRVSNGTLYRTAVGPVELTQLLQSGYSNPVTLGYALAVPSGKMNPAMCTAHASLTDRINGYFSGQSSPGHREGLALFTLATACFIQRVLDGHIVTPEEQKVAAVFAAADPEAVRAVRNKAAEILSSSTQERAALLGNLAALDPGTCSAPVDLKTLATALQERGAGAFNDSVLPDGKNFTVLRAPQCQGVHYASSDPAPSLTGDRAVTAVQEVPHCPVGDVCPVPTLVGRLKPVVYGIRPEDASVVSPLAANWAAAHPDVGLPLVGIDIGDCSSCAQALGQMCVNGRCRQYPIVPVGTAPVLTGASFWDGIAPSIQLWDITAANPALAVAAQLHSPVPQVGESLSARCDPQPVSTSSRILAPTDAAQICGSFPADPRCPAQTTVGPNENRVERIHAAAPFDGLTINRFYYVQVINENGHFFQWDDQRPLDDASRQAAGRTVHACVEPYCDPSAVSPVASCDKIPSIDACDALPVSPWHVSPRSLTKCQQDFPQNPLGCPETPLFFASDTHSETALPIMIFLSAQQTERPIETRLVSVHCSDETGWNALGSDELVVHYDHFRPPLPQMIDRFHGSNTVRLSMDAGKTRMPYRLLVSALYGVFNPDLQSGVNIVTVVEDDDFDFNKTVGGLIQETVLAAFSLFIACPVGGGIGALVGLPGGPAGVSAGALVGCVVGMTSTFIVGSYFIWSNYEDGIDDFIGRSSWISGIPLVIDAGQKLHDGVFAATDNVVNVNAEALPLPRIDTPWCDGTVTVDPFGQRVCNGHSFSIDLSVDPRIAAKHPAVDRRGYNSNTQLVSCSTSSDCNTGQVCYVGACVSVDWRSGAACNRVADATCDPTIPPGFVAGLDAPGTLERQRFHKNADYQLFFSTAFIGR